MVEAIGDEVSGYDLSPGDSVVLFPDEEIKRQGYESVRKRYR